MRPGAQEDEDVDDTALRDPVGVGLGNLLLRLEVGHQLPEEILEGREREGRWGSPEQELSAA